VYAGAAQSDPILAAFQRVVVAHRIPEQYPRELLAGMQMDARGTHYQTRADLLLYCYRVAGTVGLMMCHVMGVKDPAALRNAAHLGIAMQLTNVCRDVLEDLTLERVYLPAELLAEPGASAPQAVPRNGVELAQLRPAVARATRTLLSDAEHYYRSADRGLAALGMRSALAVRTARLLYAAIGDRIAQQGYDPWCGRAVTPARWKAALLLKALLITLCEVPRRILSRARLTIPSHAVEPHDVVPL
jgi:phytoene synthase